MSTLDLQVYEIFKSKLGEKEAGIVIEYFESKTESKFQEKKDILATKQDLAETKTDIIKWVFIFLMGQTAAIIAVLKLLH